jgi:hypothetical protein
MYVILFIRKNTERRCQMLIFRQNTLIFLCTKNKLSDQSNCMMVYAKTEQHRTKIKNGHCLQIVASAKVQYKQNLQMLYVFFWVIPRRLNFICRHFRTLCLFHLHRQVVVPTCLWRWNRQSVQKHQHIKFRGWGITQKKTYNIQNTAKDWNQKLTNPRVYWCSSTFSPVATSAKALVT